MNDKWMEEVEESYKQSYLDYKKGLFDTEEWGSHQPLLIHTVNTITEGSVMELGMGDNSTPLLGLLCEKQERMLYSYEFDKGWFNKYENYESDYHKLFLLSEWGFRGKEYPFSWLHHSIIFIDSHPQWTRQYALNKLRDDADYIIIHDVSYMRDGIRVSDNNYDFSGYKNVLIFDKVNRTSALLSNKDIPDELKAFFI